MKTCTKCEKPMIAKGLCQKHYDQTRLEKRRASSLAWYRVHRKEILEKKKEYNSEYRRAHYEELSAYNAEYRMRPENRAKANARTQAWYRANIEKAKRDGIVRSIAWQKAHPIEAKARTRAWDKAHPEDKKARLALYRARKKGADGKHTGSEVVALYGTQGGRCNICHNELGRKYHKDHILALARGGSNWIENIQLLCPSCNHRKGVKDHSEFVSSLVVSR